jgi:transketolase
MRTTFINQLVEEARQNERIFLLVGDLGFHVVEPFAEAFPERFLNVGICEQNMAGIAGGLAMNGWIVYCYSIGNFPTLRCIEQIRNDIVYYNSNVRIVSVGAGYAYGSQGVSHQATEDVAMLRSLPNMVVCSPSDPVETKMLVHLSVTHQGPMYIRLGKAGEQVFHPQEIQDYHLGDLLPILDKGSETLVLTSGSILASVMESVETKALNDDVWTIPVVKPLNVTQLCALAEQYAQIIVVEENQKSAGIGSAIIEVLSDAYNNGILKVYLKIRRIAINDEFLEVAGSQRYLQQTAGLIL